MKVTLRWLQDFAPFDQSVDVLGDTMSDLGMAVEERWTVGAGLDGIVVAEVLALRPHPDADRIQLVDVDRGDGEALQIACGAFNMAVGDQVPLATVGTVMPNGMEIAARKMRGEMSNGMLCSAVELGMGDDAAGIMVLSGHQLGTPLTEAMGIEQDVAWDLEVNANRPDAMSVAGVARDVAARLGVPFTMPDPAIPETGPGADTLASVEILDPVLCGRFLVRVLQNITVGPGPRWMANRLAAVGMRSISNVVDVSNYVMAELGQPNHTYDLGTVPGGALRVRRATAGETLVTLDGVERSLIEADGVIADGSDTAIGLAGVMGGASTEITDRTTDVLVEMAWWRPEDIARTSTRLQLRSEASLRFERGTDPEGVERAARRFCQLLAESGATTVPGVVDGRGELPARDVIRVRSDQVNKVLGTELPADEMAALLGSIEFEVTEVDGADGQLDVLPPSFRPDTTVEIDVVEEVARHYGYERIVRTMPRSAHSGGLSAHHTLKRRVQDTLVGAGLDEAMPIPFLGPGDLERVGLSPDAVELTNPLVSEESRMRTSLRPGLLAAVAHNERHRQPGAGLFEIGRVFVPAPDQRLPHQPTLLGVVRAGSGVAGAVDDWFRLQEALRIPDPSVVGAPVTGLHGGRSGELRSGETVIGDIGEVPRSVLGGLGIEQEVAWLGLDLDVIEALERPAAAYRLVSRHPSSDVDLAFDVADTVPAAAVDAVLHEAGGALLVDLWLFDVFRGPTLGEGRRSLAYGLRFQAPDRTLTADDVALARQACIDAVEQAFDARLRA